MGPLKKLVAKAKDGKGSVKLFALWGPSEKVKFPSWSFEKAYGDAPGVKSITLTDGTVITADSHFLNVYDNEKKDDKAGF